eukprot:13645733-Ditylum_brightwellii.AAC.1
MVVTTYDIDNKNNIFNYPELTCIHSKPTTANILTLCNKVQANAQAVTTTLRGGANGHLGLVCDPSTYANIPGTQPYTRLVPPMLTIPARATQLQADIFCKCVVVMGPLKMSSFFKITDSLHLSKPKCYDHTAAEFEPTNHGDPIEHNAIYLKSKDCYPNINLGSFYAASSLEGALIIPTYVAAQMKEIVYVKRVSWDENMNLHSLTMVGQKYNWWKTPANKANKEFLPKFRDIGVALQYGTKFKPYYDVDSPKQPQPQ